ncbi:cytosolic protein [Fredinandcohnia quinoae]|uniref:Cytosolic protein n=1 Tax=Fredinandcohnia quinoae TaxID=2918902 RepID=A0AAW5E732_9BACI|nr:cytosolic protein [Fredinandcohnia sp. SECRCQ15]MCH1627299.1 cytosolic protein [Fredinandcohnia sp. SECRCQ15]
MGFKQTFQMLTTSHSETSDNHWDELLKSHYYKSTNKKTIDAVKSVIEGLDGYHITSISEERGEMSVSVKKRKKAFVVVTIISVRPFETAVDFAVSTDTKVLPTDFGFSRKVIKELYENLDKALTFIGTGARK